MLVSSDTPALSARHLCKSYSSGDSRMDILKGIDLTARCGELTLLMGPSGSGKSTLMAVLAGLSRPDRGTVSILGQPIDGLGEDELTALRLRHCGFIFQSPNLFGALSALDQVRLVLQLTGAPASEIDARAWQGLKEVGLGDRAHLKPSAMSGGEKQRVAIARALVKNPTLLFADEPTSALDRNNGDLVIRILRRIAHRNGAAVLCVTHDNRLVGHADRIVTMDDGRIVADERPEMHDTFHQRDIENATS
ncbi:ABC transporter ATP-binding protein [Azospirillum sp. TSH100]|uniref:ABC transporter ATP-binding protein n=1 Tax=Azospirillum sp. TSH100 TaxID=652764 RepID=UPI000D610736|nr:ABC transporter ATP-binding protein [Azospirillum sp. TSH100]PWC83311.1 ABC transporter ATP-binding protein [Azospirillum sp. TSH100]QCG90424.1 ABC transporter ATP-binding protein [Azospirillum sp. TSH100]